MSVIHGKVQAITKPNKGGYISIKVDNVYYGVGKKAPTFDVGSVVQFEAEEKDGFWNADPKTLLLKNASKTAQEAPGGDPSTGSKGSTDWTEKNALDRLRLENERVKQPSIEFQCALKASVDVMVALIAAGKTKNLTDLEIDEEVVRRAGIYFESIREVTSKGPDSVAKPQQAAKRSQDEDPDDELPLFK